MTMIGGAALLSSGLFYALALNLHAAQAELLHQQSDRIAAESRGYCEKWGFSEGTERYRGCVLDLRDIRKHEARRVQDDYFGYPELE